MALLCGASAWSAGPLGLDHAVSVDNGGIWARHNQRLVEAGTLGVVAAGALWQGGEDRLGLTYWKSLDASALALVSAEGAKHAFTRARPSQTNDPNQWFKGSGHYSFPSEEVAFMSAAVTPFVFEYAKEHPAAYALEILPAYMALARVKTGSHWQTDALAGFALGSASGYYAYRRDSSFLLSVLPGGFAVGVGKRF